MGSKENYETYKNYLGFCMSLQPYTSYADDKELDQIINILYKWSYTETLFDKLDEETCAELYNYTNNMYKNDDLKKQICETLISIDMQ